MPPGCPRSNSWNFRLQSRASRRTCGCLVEYPWLTSSIRTKLAFLAAEPHLFRGRRGVIHTSQALLNLSSAAKEEGYLRLLVASGNASRGFTSTFHRLPPHLTYRRSSARNRDLSPTRPTREGSPHPYAGDIRLPGSARHHLDKGNTTKPCSSELACICISFGPDRQRIP